MASLQILLLLCITVSVIAAGHLEKRIYEGRDCNDTERLYHVELRRYAGRGYYRCGGSLISDRWILSAAHCWDSSWTSMHVIVGVHPGKSQVKMEIKKADIFTFINNTKVHDIMLLRLPENITDIRPIALPDCTHQPNLNELIEVAGNGNCQLNQTKHEVNRRPPKLQCAQMTVEDCNNYRTAIQRCTPNEPYGNWLCAQPSAGETCKGDSGGGAVFNNSIHAVVSRVPKCHNNSMTFRFLKVCPYLQWIQNTMNVP